MSNINNNSDKSDNSDTSDNEINEITSDIDDTPQTNSDVLSQIDKKLILKYHREGKNSRTYIIGLNNYFDDAKQIDFMKTFKKKLGTSCTKTIIDNNMVYGFGGDHVNTLYEYFAKIVPKHELKKQ